MVFSPQAGHDEALLTVAEVAEFLGVPRATLYRWRYNRVGPRALRVGRYLRFRPDDLRAWLAEREIR